MTRDSLGEEAKLREPNKFWDEFDVAKFVQAMAVEDLAQAVAAEVVATLPRIIRNELPEPADDDVPPTIAQSLDRLPEGLTAEARLKVIDRGEREGFRRGIHEIRALTQAYSVLTVLKARHIELSRPIRERLVSEKDPERLARWLKAACIAKSVEDIDWDLLTVPAEPG
jgi:hypothetical protein